LARPELCPVHSVGRDIAAESVPAPAHFHPVRQRRTRIPLLRRAPSRNRPHIKVNRAVGTPVRGLGIHRARIQRVAYHHSGRHIAHSALQAHHSSNNRAVARQGLIHEVKRIGIAVDPRSSSVYAERPAAVTRASCHAHRAHILIQPSIRQWFGRHRENHGVAVVHARCYRYH
jgi:hypothetical protein